MDRKQINIVNINKITNFLKQIYLYMYMLTIHYNIQNLAPNLGHAHFAPTKMYGK